MATIEESLRSISSSKALDVATGRGDFIFLLKENLGSFGSAVGVDIKKSDAWSSAEFDHKLIEFQELDAVDLNYSDETFDLVSISNSLHHMKNPKKVLSEMIRVLKPGGTFVFHEMFTDRQTPAQLTHTLLHQWWGKIDTAAGIFHDSPYKRSVLTQFLKDTGIAVWEYFDEADLSEDPFDPGTMEELDKIINTYQSKTKDTVLIAEGEQLRQRVKSIGFHSATQLFAIGKKA